VRRTVLVLILVSTSMLMGWTANAEESGKRPKAALSLQVGGLLAAPLGIEAELLFGPVGLAVESRLFVRRMAGEWAGTLEPGLNLRLYFGEPEQTLFFFGGADFLMIWSLQPFALDQGFVKPRAGFGYHRLLGNAGQWRLALEIGAAWLQPVNDGELYDLVSPLLPHFLLVFGRAF